MAEFIKKAGSLKADHGVLTINVVNVKIPAQFITLEIRGINGDFIGQQRFQTLFSNSLSISLPKGKYMVILMIPGYVPKYYSIIMRKNHHHSIRSILLPLKNCSPVQDFS
ncbi:hypothetical protein ACFFJY_15610 [Fictibacillus aquaticus]|uniref:Uncharacterized protein n=1 Tax=Fictibacillus aquaticus TaxID=2021314 RepID=A0A235FE10_9BACL|nr:hypothetical protein [Fictibacillus aquaticus]OYD59630.1 hypothetical protein CGZ90_07015 [Fictibacillus aquaticus]